MERRYFDSGLPGWRQKLKEFGAENPWVNFAKALRDEYPDMKKGFFAEGNIIILDEAQGSYGDINISILESYCKRRPRRAWLSHKALHQIL